MKMRSWSSDTFLADMYCGLKYGVPSLYSNRGIYCCNKKKIDIVNVVADAAIGKTIPMFCLQ